MKKIMILTSNAGGGHMSITRAIKGAFDKHYKDSCEVTVVQLGNFAPLNDVLSDEGYKLAVNAVPSLYKFGYDVADNNGLNELKRNLKQLNKGKPSLVVEYKRTGPNARFRKLVEKHQPDVIIGAYYIATSFALYTKAQYGYKYKVMQINCDFNVNYQYYKFSYDAIVCMSDLDKETMLSVGIPEEKIYMVGYPIQEQLLTIRDKKYMCEKYNLLSSKNILVMGGGFGHKLEKLVKLLVASITDYNIIVMCASNEKLLAKLTKLQSLAPNLFPFGFIDVTDVGGFMDISDIVVSKCGGNSITEFMAKQLPVMLFNPIPGQEEDNKDYLLNKGLCFYSPDYESLIVNLKTALKDEFALNRMKEAMRHYYKPNAAKKIADLALKLIDE